MLNTLLNVAPIIGLIFFFTVFLGIVIWAMRPSAKQKLQSLAYIPLKEDNHG